MVHSRHIARPLFAGLAVLALAGTARVQAASLSPVVLESSPFSVSIDGHANAAANGSRYNSYNEYAGIVSPASEVFLDETVINQVTSWGASAPARDPIMGLLAMADVVAGVTSTVQCNGPWQIVETASLNLYYANAAGVGAYASGALYNYWPSWRQAGFNAEDTRDNLVINASFDLTVSTSGFIWFEIQPRAGDRPGDPINVTIGDGSQGAVHYNGLTYDASTPRVINAHIGDVIGLRPQAISAASSWSGPARDEPVYENYLDGDSHEANLSIHIPLSRGLGADNGMAPSATPEPNHRVFSNIFPAGTQEGVGTTFPVWLDVGMFSSEYQITITDNTLASVRLPSDLPESPLLNIQYFDGEDWIDAREFQSGTGYGYVADDEIVFDPAITQFRLLGIAWDYSALPETFSLGFKFAAVGTQVDIVAVPEPATLSLLGVFVVAMLARRRLA